MMMLLIFGAPTRPNEGSGAFFLLGAKVKNYTSKEKLRKLLNLMMNSVECGRLF